MTQDTSVTQTTTMSTVLMVIQDMLVTPTARSYSTQVSPPIETTGYHSHDLFIIQFRNESKKCSKFIQKVRWRYGKFQGQAPAEEEV